MSTPRNFTSKHAGQAKILFASVSYSHQPFVKPLILSTGSIESITQADAVVRVSVGDVEAEGRGCIYLSDLWAWPDPAISPEKRADAMRLYCRRLADTLPDLCGETLHPLTHGLRLHETACTARSRTYPSMPILARSVCASIYDAAIHDAVGKALGVSAFDLYDEHLATPADKYFGGSGACFASIKHLLESPPREDSPAWWVVGKSDNLEQDLRPVVEECGYFAFKLKIMGQNPEVDSSRVIEVYRSVRDWGVNKPRLTIDSNEANPDADSVSKFLDHLESQDQDAYDALEMIEQPTGRDIQKHAFDWSQIAARKPVMVDEGLTTMDMMPLAKKQGWSGFALKTCKGHSFALAAAAWAHQHGMLLSLQDLTNPGLSGVHAALFASRVPTMNGVELNSPQFTPAANREWLDRYPHLFQIRSGEQRLPDPLVTPGLGG